MPQRHLRAGNGIGAQRVGPVEPGEQPSSPTCATPQVRCQLSGARQLAQRIDRALGRERPDIQAQDVVEPVVVETVPSRYLTVRPGARYFHSIRLLQRVKEMDPTIFTKSGIMVGLGEERHEVLQVMDDLRSAEVDSSPSASICSRRASITP